MTRFVLRRLVGSVFVFFLVASLVFAMVQAAPGNAATALGGTFGSKDSVAQLRHQYGLDRPFLVQYGSYIAHLARLNLGTSNATHESVLSQLGSRAAPTLELAGLAVLFAVLVAVALGVIAAMRKGSWFDSVVRVSSVVAISIPQFWLGLVLVVVFGVTLPGILPTGGWVPFSVNPGQNLLHLVLPVFVLGIGALGVVARTMRSSMLEVLDRDYVAFAIGTGVPQGRIIRSIAMPNAAIPATTVIGLLIGFLVGGTVVVEQVFSIPGIGQMLVQSFALRDLPSGIGATLFIAASFLLTNLLVDVGYAFLDPRIRGLYRGTNGGG